MDTKFFEQEYIRKGFIAFLIIINLFFIVKTIGTLREYKYIGAGVQAMTTINVSGEGKINITPDIATFNFSVLEEAKNVKAAQDSVTKSVSEIIASMKDLGIDEKDVKTQAYNIYPIYDYRTEAIYCPVGYDCYPPEGKRTLTGYEVSQSIEVRVRDLNKTGEILAALGSMDIDNLYGPNFSVEDESEVVAKAREEAIKDAKEKAKKLAKDLGVKLVRIVNFNESGGYPGYFAKEEAALYGMGGDGFVPEIPIGENTITSNVFIIYEIR